MLLCFFFCIFKKSQIKFLETFYLKSMANMEVVLNI